MSGSKTPGTLMLEGDRQILYKQALEKIKKRDHHFTELVGMGIYRRCLKCRKNKSAYRCEGCTETLGTNITVCINCMEGFHANLSTYVPEYSRKSLKFVEQMRVISQYLESKQELKTPEAEDSQPSEKSGNQKNNMDHEKPLKQESERPPFFWEIFSKSREEYERLYAEFASSIPNKALDQQAIRQSNILRNLKAMQILIHTPGEVTLCKLEE